MENHVISREKSSCDTGDKIVIRRCNTSESFRNLREEVSSRVKGSAIWDPLEVRRK